MNHLRIIHLCNVKEVSSLKRLISKVLIYLFYLFVSWFHNMTGDKSLFSTLEEKDLMILIEMGDNESSSVSGVGTISFQREHGASITLTDVRYVPGLKKNLVSIAMLEDRL